MRLHDQIILESNRILIRPLSIKDKETLKDIAFDPDIWKYTPSRISDESDLDKYIANALNEREKDLRYSFLIITKELNFAAGSTSYGNISFKDKRIEIGWSWLGKNYRGSGINEHCKFLLMEYAFERLGFVRVEFKTDVLNIAARKALLKIGAVEEGVLRSHTLMNDGRRRDTIYYSVLANEWQSAKEKLLLKIK